jgi:CheY-like chemotaxis protein
MSPEVQAHIFEPFFTTKETGKGVGLGLSTVYGIVERSGGHIWIYSEEGQGTTFKIYLPHALPMTEDAVLAGQTPVVHAQPDHETILLLEDNDAVRQLTRDVLVQHGYAVLEASCGKDAIKVAHKYNSTLSLLLTDLIMPGMTGKDLADRLVESHPDLKVLFMSGYTDNIIVHHGMLDEDVQFIQKPFSPSQLLQKVRQVLAEP